MVSSILWLYVRSKRFSLHLYMIHLSTVHFCIFSRYVNSFQLKTRASTPNFLSCQSVFWATLKSLWGIYHLQFFGHGSVVNTCYVTLLEKVTFPAGDKGHRQSGQISSQSQRTCYQCQHSLKSMLTFCWQGSFPMIRICTCTVIQYFKDAKIKF